MPNNLTLRYAFKFREYSEDFDIVDPTQSTC